MRTKDRYEAAIHLPHHRSARYPQMPQRNRAAQFLPFAALAGYEEAIKETARLTEPRPELTDSRKEELNACLQQIRYFLENRPDRGRNTPCVQAEITWFQQDARKAGGTSATESVEIQRIDVRQGLLLCRRGRRIRIEDIENIEDIRQPED
jgi:hypothetical protein